MNKTLHKAYETQFRYQNRSVRKSGCVKPNVFKNVHKSIFTNTNKANVLHTVALLGGNPVNKS